jgi:hypothetical protein
MAASKKNAARLGAHLVFADESGFLLTPTIAKTWAPVGRTPVVRHLDRRDRISAISAISVSPMRRRPNLYFQLYPKTIQQAEVCLFLRNLLVTSEVTCSCSGTEVTLTSAYSGPS